MDFQSAMETFAEAWVAANTKADPVQSQALALTHKASPPSRPTSVSPIPRSPQSHQSHQSHQAHAARSPTPRPSSVHHPQLHQAQPSSLIGVQPAQHQQPHQQVPQSFGIHHNRHPKQEVDSISPKLEGFDLSKTASVVGGFATMGATTELRMWKTNFLRS